jgi:hypothetical protein
MAFRNVLSPQDGVSDDDSYDLVENPKKNEQPEAKLRDAAELSTIESTSSAALSVHISDDFDDAIVVIEQEKNDKNKQMDIELKDVAELSANKNASPVAISASSPTHVSSTTMVQSITAIENMPHSTVIASLSSLQSSEDISSKSISQVPESPRSVPVAVSAEKAEKKVEPIQSALSVESDDDAEVSSGCFCFVGKWGAACNFFNKKAVIKFTAKPVPAVVTLAMGPNKKIT